MTKLRGKYRYHALIQGPDRDALREIGRTLMEDMTPPDDVQWIVDIDPLDML